MVFKSFLLVWLVVLLVYGRPPRSALLYTRFPYTTLFQFVTVQPVGDGGADRLGLGSVSGFRCAHRTAVLGRTDQPLQLQLRAVEPCQRRDRHVAAAVQRAVHRALGLDAGAGRRVVERRAKRDGARIVVAAFDQIGRAHV